MKNRAANRYYLFGPFRLDVTERLLYGQRGVIRLTPKTFDTLLALVENRGHVLGKEELMQRVWPDSFVEENNLAQNISVLRRVLSEEVGAEGEKFIETVPKRGYRFVSEVTESFADATRGLETGADNQMQSCHQERSHKKIKSSLRDVVIIGRAIKLK
jgi:DNA-binding winged helix-turn-helix (wHTH) protein